MQGRIYLWSKRAIALGPPLLKGPRDAEEKKVLSRNLKHDYISALL